MCPHNPVNLKSQRNALSSTKFNKDAPRCQIIPKRPTLRNVWLEEDKLIKFYIFLFFSSFCFSFFLPFLNSAWIFIYTKSCSWTEFRLLSNFKTIMPGLHFPGLTKVSNRSNFELRRASHFQFQRHNIWLLYSGVNRDMFSSLKNYMWKGKHGTLASVTSKVASQRVLSL